MSGWLPPGCTDKDVDDAAPQDEPFVECDGCHELFEPWMLSDVYLAVEDQTLQFCNWCYANYMGEIRRKADDRA